jgi:hypothetical protein
MTPPDVSFASNATPEERRRQVAALLARGVVRHRRQADLAEICDFSHVPSPGLEVVSETRLSVSKGLAAYVRDRTCEVRNGDFTGKPTGGHLGPRPGALPAPDGTDDLRQSVS